MKRNFIFTVLMMAFVLLVNAQGRGEAQFRCSNPGQPSVGTPASGELNQTRDGWMTWAGTFDLTNGIGTGSASQFSIGHRFAVTDLTSHVGEYITKVKFVPNGTTAQFTLCIYKGGSSTDPGQLIYQQAIPNYTTNAENEVDVLSSIQIEANNEYWIVLNVNDAGGYPAGVDEGPAVEGKGNMMYFDGEWTTLSQLGATLVYNWSISTYTQTTAPTLDPMLMTAPTSLSWALPASATPQVKQVQVLAYNATAAVTATTTAPFQVSSDNTTFGATATIPQTGGTLYVKVNTNVPGTYTDSITLSSTGADNVTVALAAELIDCSTAETLPFTEDFENGIPLCWQTLDIDGDGYNWYHNTLGTGHNDSYCAGSESFSNTTYTALTPDNWLISPAITLPTNGARFQYWVAPQDPDYNAETYAVYVSTTGTDTSDFTLLFTETINFTDWTKREISLANYSGDVHIAFRHFNSNDVFVLLIDDISIFAMPTDPTIEADPMALDFGSVSSTSTPVAQSTNLLGFNLTTGITATATAPFEVSSDNTTFGTTATIAQNGGTLYIRMNNTTGGVYADSVVLSATGAENIAIMVNGEVVECDVIDEFPLEEGFESHILCWDLVYGAANPVNEMGIYADESGSFAYEGLGSFMFSSYSTDEDSYSQYLITPELSFTNAMNVRFKYLSYFGGETFVVGYSTTTNDISAFTWGETVNADNADAWATYTQTIPANAKYVAIHYTSEWMYYLFIDKFEIYEPQFVTVTGTATTSGAALQGVTVKFVGDVALTATTDAQGAYSLQMEAGTYNISAEMTGYNSISLPATAVSSTNNVFNFDMELTPCAAPQITATPDGMNVIVDWGVNVTLRADDVWGDGSGYQLLLDADATAYGNEIPTEGALTTGGDADPSVYAAFEYKIPENADGACSTTNMVVADEVTINIPVGVYDYVITNPTPGDRIWIAAGENARKDNYEFESGYDYEFYVSFGGNNDQTEIIKTPAGSAKSPTYKVYRNGQLIATVANGPFVDEVTEIGEYCYTVEATCDNGVVSEMSNEVCVNVTGINDYEFGAVNIYPNPATSTVTVSTTNPAQRVEVLNFVGQIIYSETVTSNVFNINVSDYADGVYFVRLIGENSTTVQKIVKK